MDLELELKFPNQINPPQNKNPMSNLAGENVSFVVLLLIAKPLIATVPLMQRRMKKKF